MLSTLEIVSHHRIRPPLHATWHPFHQDMGDSGRSINSYRYYVCPYSTVSSCTCQGGTPMIQAMQLEPCHNMTSITYFTIYNTLITSASTVNSGHQHPTKHGNHKEDRGGRPRPCHPHRQHRKARSSLVPELALSYQRYSLGFDGECNASM